MCNTDGPDRGRGTGGREAGGKRREAGEGGNGRLLKLLCLGSISRLNDNHTLHLCRNARDKSLSSIQLAVLFYSRSTKSPKPKKTLSFFLQRYFCRHAPTGLSAARLNHQPAQRGAAAGLGGQIGYYHRWLSRFVSHSLLAWPQPATRNSRLIIHANRHRRRNRP
jgi:hypothetical protein